MKFYDKSKILLQKTGYQYPLQIVNRVESGSLVFSFSNLSGVSYKTHDSGTKGVTARTSSWSQNISWSYYAFVDDWEVDPQYEGDIRESVFVGTDQEVYVSNGSGSYEWKSPSDVKVGDVCYAMGRNVYEENVISAIYSGSCTDAVVLDNITHGFVRHSRPHGSPCPAYLVRVSGSSS